MTPFAYKILMNGWDKFTARTGRQFLQGLDTAQYFECSDLMNSSGPKIVESVFSECDSSVIVPSPVTWLEFAFGCVEFGYLIKTQPDRVTANVDYMVFYDDLKKMEHIDIGFLHLTDRSKTTATYNPNDGDEARDECSTALSVCEFILLALASKSTAATERREPSLTKIRQIKNRRKNERPIINKSWTKVSLFVDFSPRTVSDSDEKAHKVLHWCRQHLRRCNGKVVIVKGHWRGDEAAGTKQSRYKVVPPKGAVA